MLEPPGQSKLYTLPAIVITLQKDSSFYNPVPELMCYCLHVSCVMLTTIERLAISTESNISSNLVYLSLPGVQATRLQLPFRSGPDRTKTPPSHRGGSRIKCLGNTMKIQSLSKPNHIIKEHNLLQLTNS